MTPSHANFIKDLNTGRAYTKTYKKLIERPGEQVLLPVIFYIDGATTGQFVDLPVTAVKFSLGIFTQAARDKEYCWRTLGYIPAVDKYKSKANRIILNSRHVDGMALYESVLNDEGEEDNDEVPKAQDLHSMLEVV